MNRALRLAAAACLLPCFALAADRPAVRLGLWEITHEANASGAPALPEEVLARMPPEMRSRMEAQAALGGKHTARQCVTEKDLDHPFGTDDGHQQHCTHTITSRTATSMVVALLCKNEAHGIEIHGTLKWQLLSPESMQGTIDMALGNGASAHHSTLSGKWLSADCGDVKPAGPQDP